MNRVFLIIILLGGVQSSVAQTIKPLSFDQYSEASELPFQSAVNSEGYWKEFYARKILRYERLKIDIQNLFNAYLKGDPLPRSSQFTQLASKDFFLSDRFAIASSAALVEASLQELEKSKDSQIAKAIRNARKVNELFPLHFRVYDDENSNSFSAYYERGTHKVKMSLDRIDPKNWLTWFVHEHLHFLDPVLRSAQSTVAQPGRIKQIGDWIETDHTVLSASERETLNSYFADLTDISIQAEWRAWVATSLFAQKALHDGLLITPPPCLSFLVEHGFGTRELPIEELKLIWWNKLKAGFYIEPTGLFTHSWMKSQYLDYLDTLQPAQLRLPLLLEITQ